MNSTTKLVILNIILSVLLILKMTKHKDVQIIKTSKIEVQEDSSSENFFLNNSGISKDYFIYQQAIVRE